MKVYHGTLKENAKSIFSQKIIRTTNEKNTQYSTEGYAKTTYGFVYVSKSLNEALGFALLATENKIDKQEVAVFQIDIREDECENDMDEEKHNAIVTQVELPENSCLRISRDLVFGEDIKRYCLLSFINFNAGCKYADNPKLEEIIKDRWKTV